MCQKEVDLHLSRSCQFKQPPELQEMESIQSPLQCSGSRSLKNRAITKKERREYNSGISVDHKSCSDRQRVGIIIEGLRNQQQAIQQTKLHSTNIQSVGGCCLQPLSGTYYTFANCDTKKSPIIDARRSLKFAAFSLQWVKKVLPERSTFVAPGKVVPWISILLLFGTFCRAHGTGGTFLGNSFPSKMKLNCPRPGKWLCGPKTIAVNETNLIIDYQNMTTYICEVSAPNPALCTFHMQVFNSCAIDEKEDFDAFKGGKKYIEVELDGKVAGSGSIRQQYYGLFIRSDTVEISPYNVSDFQLQLDSIRCNIKYKNMELYPPVNGSIGPVLDNTTQNIAKGDGGISKLGKGILIGAGVVFLIVPILILGTKYGIARWRKRGSRSIEFHNLDEAKPAIDSP